LADAAQVIKCDASDKVAISAAENEVRLQGFCSHPNILRIDGMFKPMTSTRSIVMEYCPGGDLENAIIAKEAFTESEARTICLVLLNAIAYLHSNDIVHCDIKPQNVLLANPVLNGQGYENNLRLTDFGFSAVAEGNVLSHISGSPPFHAPELVDPTRFGSYGKPVDMWAYGVTVYYLLSGRLPFSQASLDQLHYEILYQDVLFPDDGGWNAVSDGARNFIKKLLDKSMDSRLAAVDALQDPWVTQKLLSVMSFISLCDSVSIVYPR
jgi:serine/threonine protein kinase